MNLSLQEDQNGDLIIRQGGISLLRLIIGLPLLLFGAFLLYGAFSSFIIQIQEGGWANIPVALVGSLVLLLFTALVLPLGWWLVFSSHWITLEQTSRDIVKTSDWKLGRKNSRVPAADFRAVRVALEPLDSSSNAAGGGRKMLCQQIRLLAHDPKKRTSLELGALEYEKREQIIDIAPIS